MDLGRQLRVIVVEPDELVVCLPQDDPAVAASAEDAGGEEAVPAPIRADRP